MTNLADALAITDALIYLVRGEVTTVDIRLADGKNMAQAVLQARAGREKTNGLRH